MVLSVLNQQVPVIHKKIERLEDDTEITSDYSAHLVEMDVKDAQQECRGRILVEKREWDRCQGDNRTM